MRRWLVRVSIALLALFLLIQVVPSGRTNPPASSPLAVSPEVMALLRRSCFDCHSNETRWPWYAYVAPVSWMLVHDVNEGREHLNFSRWGEYPAKKRVSAAEEVVEEVERGQMPLEGYLKLHPDAKLTPADVAMLRAWADDVE